MENMLCISKISNVFGGTFKGVFLCLPTEELLHILPISMAIIFVKPCSQPEGLLIASRFKLYWYE